MISWFLIAALIIAGYFLIYILLKWRIDRTMGSGELLREIREELNQMLMELNSSTEQNIQLIEDRIESLRSLLAQADKRMKVYSKEMERKRPPDTYVNLKSSKPIIPPQIGPLSRDKPIDFEKMKESVKRDTLSVDENKEGTLATQGSSFETGDGNKEKTLKERVLEMDRQGISSQLIASRVGSTVGEVELIISLGKRKG